VPGKREQVAVERLDIDRQPCRGGDRVDDEKAALRCLLADRLADRLNRLERADLVVGELDRDHGRALVERAGDMVRVDATVAIDRQLDDLEPELLELLEAMEHGVVLDGAGHDPMAAGLARPGGALEREVQRLCATAGQDDLAGARVDLCRDPLVGLVQGRARAPPEAVRG
jgi:hypothetical protein